MKDQVPDLNDLAKDNPYEGWDPRPEMLNLLANILKDNLDVLDDPAHQLHGVVVGGLHACLGELQGELISYCETELAAA